MRVLFDQGTPVPLRQHLPNHSVSTAHEMGWSSLNNGDLLRQAQDHGFDVLVTTDQNLKYQQNLSDRRIAIVVLGTTSWPRLQSVLPQIATAIDRIAPGGYAEIPAPHR
jgi:hypothetical protein